jgi:hypothetical protein
MNYFLLHIPSEVGAKYTFPSSDNLISGAVQIPTSGILIFELPGISLRVIFKFDLYNLYYFGVNSMTIKQKFF